ncbi:MAG: hypothetical protein K2J30_01000 [Clostridia bacterium]|nr:hypothetical protein [Clostridia bacterium]
MTGTDNAAFINWLEKGEKIVLTGTHKSNGGANWDSIRVGVFSGLTPATNFRADRWIEGSDSDNQATVAAEKWNIVKEGEDLSAESWGSWNTEMRNCQVTVTFDWSDESKIVVTIAMGNNPDYAFAYTITAQENETLADKYNINVGYNFNYASLTVSEMPDRT